MRVADIDELRVKVLARPRPWSASIEITRRCNLRCVHCLRVQADDDGLSYGEVCDVLDQLVALGCFKVVFTGGEPFARRDFMSIVEQAWRRRLAIVILTNATMLTPETVGQCRQCHVSELQVSVYAADAATHDAVTQQAGSYQRTLRGIELALANGLNVRIATPIMACNAEALPALRAAWKDRGVSLVEGSLLFPKTDGDATPLGLVTTDRQLRQLLAGQAEESCREMDGSRKIPLATSLCPAGIERLGIAADGSIYPCDALRLAAGNIRADRLADVWSGSAVFMDLRSRRREYDNECAGCGVRGYCTWCPGLSAQLMGNIAVPNAQDCRRTRLSYGLHTTDLPGWSVPARLRHDSLT